MKILSTLSLLLIIASPAIAGGTICIDPIADPGNWKGNSTGATRNSVFTVQIGKSTEQRVTRKAGGIIKNLDLSAKHTVVIKMDGKPYASFKFSFKEKGSNHLRLWYKEFYGTWQLWKPGLKHKCAYLEQQKEKSPSNKNAQKPANPVPGK